MYSGARAQDETDPNEGLTIVNTPNTHPTLPFQVTWWGRPNFYYFVLQTSDLTKEWSYHDFAVKGSLGSNGRGDVEGFRFDSSSKMLFFRLEFTDDPNSELLKADFDGDFVPNGAELDLGTDVFDMLFADPDFLPDEWETFYFGNLTTASDTVTNWDGDALVDGQEFLAGLNPKKGFKDVPVSTPIVLFTPR